jgi:hypothetical protein
MSASDERFFANQISDVSCFLHAGAPGALGKQAFLLDGAPNSEHRHGKHYMICRFFVYRYLGKPQKEHRDAEQRGTDHAGGFVDSRLHRRYRGYSPGRQRH